MRLVVVLFVALAVGAAFARGGSAPGRGTATLTGGGRTVTLRASSRGPAPSVSAA